VFIKGEDMSSKPRLSFWQIWNMCFGFLGIQFGFALQNANVSRIFQTLGAEIDDIPALWIAAPLTGLLVQPLIGYYSDRTWTRLGRRRPYFLVGAILASLALIAMPYSPALWIAAGMLWILDASINVAMEPFRAYVGDQLPSEQRASGYAMQSFFIGVGAVVASALPWLLTQAGMSNVAPTGEIPDTVRYAFVFGGIVLFAAVGWTIVSTREYPPEVLASHEAAVALPVSTARFPLWLAVLLGVVGVLLLASVWHYGLERELYLLGAGLVLTSALFLIRGSLPDGLLRHLLDDIVAMPAAMRQLAWVQFFSWFGLFAMWIFTTAGVAAHHYGTTDTSSQSYNDAADWVGVLFAGYNGFSILAAICIPWLVRVAGLKFSHIINLWLGAAGLLSFYWIDDPHWLLLPMLGVGFAWASILSLPYAMLADSVPAKKMGTYMGVFNFFIVIPQLIAATLLGVLLKHLFNGEPIYALLIGGASFVLASLAVLRVRSV
jgi:maltose/moltooligosaccharide transporter